MAKAYSFPHPVMALTKFAEAVGLERVRSMTIRLSVDRIATVDVSMVMTEEDSGRLVEAMKSYRLVPLDSPPEEGPDPLVRRGLDSMTAGVTTPGDDR